MWTKKLLISQTTQTENPQKESYIALQRECCRCLSKSLSPEKKINQITLIKFTVATKKTMFPSKL